MYKLYTRMRASSSSTAAVDRCGGAAAAARRASRGRGGASGESRGHDWSRRRVQNLERHLSFNVDGTRMRVCDVRAGAAGPREERASVLLLFEF